MKKHLLLALMGLTSFLPVAQSQDTVPEAICLTVAYEMGYSEAMAVLQVQTSVIEMIYGDDDYESGNYNLVPMAEAVKSYGSIPGLDQLGDTHFEVSAEAIAKTFFRYLEKNALALDSFSTSSISVNNEGYGVSLSFVASTLKGRQKLVTLSYDTFLSYDTCFGEGYIPSPTGIMASRNDLNQIEVKLTKKAYRQ